MNTEVFNKSHIEVGKQVSLIAICSRVDIVANVKTTGGYREIFTINGKDGCVMEAVQFKNKYEKLVLKGDWENDPILVEGLVSEYNGNINLVISKIANARENLSLEDLKAEMVDTTILSNLNEELYQLGSSKPLSSDYLLPSKGIEEGGFGILIERMNTFIGMAKLLSRDLAEEYAANVNRIAYIYHKTDCSLEERFASDLIKGKMMRAFMLNPLDYPEYYQFVKLHHLIVRPRGVRVEIFDDYLSTDSDNRIRRK